MYTSAIVLFALGLASLGTAAPHANFPKRADPQPVPMIKQVPLEPAMHTDALITNPTFVKLTEEHLSAFAEAAGNLTKIEPSPSALNTRDDGRHVNDNRNYPFSAVGRLYITDGSSAWVCTASLVGPRLIATASHCVFPMPGGTSWTFSPDYFNGDRFQTSQVNTIVAKNWVNLHDCTWKDDWAIMVLNDAIGNQQGWLGSMVYDDSLRWQHIYYTAGYSSDFGNSQQMFSQEQIDALQVECPNYTGPVDFEIKSDSAGTESGSPVWLQGIGYPSLYQAATLVGSASAYTVASWGPDWFNTINNLRQQFP